MAWLLLLVAGLLEIVWLVLLKQSGGFQKVGLGVLSYAVAFVSFALLGLSLRSLPAGTAYAVWTGIGAAGGAIAGVLWFAEPADTLRIAFIVLIVVGIVGLKLTAH
jgi:quaternary ammonium compound-resistance protein SugE